MKAILTTGLVLLIGLGSGCSKPASQSAAASEEARKQELKTALEKYLTERGSINVAAMDIEILQTTFAEDTAQAQVEFRTKQGQGSMQMNYTFERQGGVWVVKSSSGGGMGHPDAGMQPPPGAPGQLPPGHPPLSPPQRTQPPPQP
jgi:hypothetical protein